MANTTTAIIAARHSFFDRDLLDRAQPHLVHTWFGQVRDIPQNSSKEILFRRYELLNAATTPLTEGVTPAGSTLSVTDISATVGQYGDFIILTDVLTDTNLENTVAETNVIQGQQSGNTFDQLCRDILAAGTSVQYASSAVSRVTVTSAMKLNITEIREAVRTLKNNNATKITSMVNPSTGVDTIPVNSCFVAFVHPNTTYDLKSDTNFVPVENYPSQSGVMEGEVGKIDEVRFVETTNAKVFTGAGAAGIDVYATIVVAANAYGVTRIAGKGLTTVIHPAGDAGSADPLNQRSTQGWKGYFVTKILNDNFMLRIEHAVS